MNGLISEMVWSQQNGACVRYLISTAGLRAR